MKPLSKKTLAYISVYLLALTMLLGLAAIFEDSIQTKLIGFVVFIGSIIIGNVIAIKIWPKKNVQIKEK